MGTGKPRKRSLSSLQRDLLRTLGEAGGDDLATLANGHTNGPADLPTLKSFVSAIVGLRREGLVELQRALPSGRLGGPPVHETVPSTTAVSTLLRPDAGQGRWEPTQAGIGVEVVLTSAGAAALTE